MKQFAGEFEVHLTTHTNNETELVHFQQWCQERELKCVRIVLSRGDHVEQPMATWRRSETTLGSVLEEAEQHVGTALSEGLRIVRVKIEAAPFNKDVPIGDEEPQEPHNYFEHHIKIERRSDSPQDRLIAVSEKHGAHLSRNAFHQSDGGREQRFVTLRSYGIGRVTSDHLLQELLQDLQLPGAEILECESEYCVYDSNIALDRGWLPSSSKLQLQKRNS